MEWIKTSDKLPEVGQKVLCYQPNEYFEKERLNLYTFDEEINETDCWGNIERHEWQGFIDVWYNRKDIEEIPYWLPIPELPTT